MKSAVRLTLTAGAVALVCACTSDSLKPPIGQPLASLSDGAHSGNPDFFFYPPIFKTPTTLDGVSPGQFNASVRPTVEICELGAAVPPSPIRPCVATIVTFGPSQIQLDASAELYMVNWDTKASNLHVDKEYRIKVSLGPNTPLGFADVDPVSTGSGLKRVDTGEFIGLVDGRTLPIKFRIENGAACNGGACDSKTIDLSQGGFVVFTPTGDRVDIPAQSSGRVITVTVQSCPRLNVDLPVFGNCLNVTADPPLGETRLSPPATISMCSLPSFPLPPHPQQELITLHRRDADLIVALPHSTDFCGGSGTIGQSDGLAAPQSLAARGWRALRGAAEWLFKPTTLHASTFLFDVGAGGQTDGFSDFQFALPVELNVPEVTDLGEHIAGSVLDAAVLVTDALGAPAANATVRFNHQPPSGAEDGSVASASGLCHAGDADELVCITDAKGEIPVQWTLSGAAGANELSARTRGAGLDPDLDGSGPFDSCDPTIGALGHVTCNGHAIVPLDLSEGVVTFLATGITTQIVRISGFTSPRTPFPLFVGSTPDASSSQIVAAVQDASNFGATGTVACVAQFQPFVTTVNSRSLVDAAGNLLVDVFFAGPSATTLTASEATELAAFLDAGGILYLGGDTDDNDGPAYNSLFAQLVVDDAFTGNILRSDQSSGQSSDPPNTTPITNGPFGAVGPLEHTGYREIATQAMTALATGNNAELTLLAEGTFGRGRVSAMGDPLYINQFMVDSDNRAYFLNLFALGCK